MKTKWLKLKAGKEAYKILMERGLRLEDLKVFAGAAGGPKWIILYELDKYLLSQFLPGHQQSLHFVGASIGAWRSACYVHPEPLKAIDRLFDAYARQSYPEKPSPAEVSETCRFIIDSALGQEGFEAILSPGDRYLHVVTSRAHFNTQGKSDFYLKARFGQAVFANLLGRKRLGKHFTRELFSNFDSNIVLEDMLPQKMISFDKENLMPALRASGSIPTIMPPIVMPGGEYWDGGITDYHIDLDFGLQDQLVLYPHFLNRMIPGWLDKHNPLRKAHPDFSSHTVLLYPSAEFIDKLPKQKIPDRKDFEIYFQRDEERITAWQKAADLGKYLVEDFEQMLNPDVLMQNLEPMFS